MIDIADFFQPLVLTKLTLSLFFFLYLIFLFILINQIRRMNSVVSQATSSNLLFSAGIIQFAIAVLLLISVLVIL